MINQPRSLTPAPLFAKPSLHIYKPEENQFMNDNLDRDDGIAYGSKDDNIIKMNLTGFSN